MQDKNQRYTDEQQAEFCSLAQEIGIGRARRELGFPKSYASGITWMKARGIKPNIDKVMQQAKHWHTFYEVEDLLEQVDTALAIIQDMMVDATTADDAKKLAEAFAKIVSTRQVLMGKATSISEKRETTQADLEIAEMLAVERAKSASSPSTAPTSHAEPLSAPAGTEHPSQHQGS